MMAGALTQHEGPAMALILLLTGCHLIWPSDGQGFRPINLPPYKMVVTNALHVPDAWVVFELQMFFGHCYQKQAVPAWGGNYFSSGNRRENPESTMAQAFDNMLATNWTANCKISMVGCRPYQQYIGLDITGTGPWMNAMGDNATAEDREKCEVKCIRLFQSDHPMHKADAVAIQGVFLGGSPYQFKTIMVFDNVAGGAWSRRPAEKDTLWRVSNLWPTTVRWGVSELRLYKDIFCNDEVRGAALSSGAYQKLGNWEGRAFDDDVTTSWIADCETYHWINGVQTLPKHCGLREAWIGVDFGDAKLTVRCIKFYQATHDIETPVPQKPKIAEGVALERYDGKKWVEVERYWNQDTTATVPSSYQPTLLTPFVGTTGVKPGHWEDTRPADRAAWRLLNDDWVSRVWIVHEIEFHVDEVCGGPPLIGEAVSMAGVAGLEEAKAAFDGDATAMSEWRSTCTGLNGACLPHEAWVGLYFRDLQPNVTCFRLMQTATQIHQASSVAVGAWIGGQWGIIDIHRDVGGGTWNRRPSPPWSMWRVLNNERVVRQWRVMEVRAYNDSLCLRQLTGSNPIGSGYLNWRDNLDNGFDGTAITAWGADCNGCEDRKYWIGGELQNSSSTFHESLSAMEDAGLSGDHIVRCVRMWQSPEFFEQSPSLRVDVWNGKDWQVSTLTMTGVVGGGGGGVWIRYPSLYATRWRMVAAGTSNGPWRLHEVEFYSDTDCTDRLRIPPHGGTSVVMSGYIPEVQGYRLAELGGTDLFSEGMFPFDGSSETSVKLVRLPSSGLPAWYGIDFLSEMTWVRCVRLKQGSLTPEQTQAVYLEYWDGKKGNWSSADSEMSGREQLLPELGGGGWQRRPAADRSMWKLYNYDLVPEGWSIYEAELHESTTCINPVDGSNISLSGEPIASGFTPQEKYYGPHHAFDKDLKTPWVSQCSKVQSNLLPPGMSPPKVGCNPGEAWIGLDLHLERRDVRCVRLYQNGYRNMQSSRVGVSKWNGVGWELVWTMIGLGGSAWDQRPAGPNTLWRLYHQVTRAAKCNREKNRIFRRTWGVSEIEFYSDDDCTEKVMDGSPISSGTVEAYRETPYDPKSYEAPRAFDGDVDTEWAANCLLGWKEMNQSRTNCEGEWLGFDFGSRSVEVRCIRVMQSRRESSTCCDPASTLLLHRWDGGNWVEASWRHEPMKGSKELPRNLGAEFLTMGKCQEDSYEGDINDLRIWEKRGRRDSAECLVPLTGATVLLGEPSCIEHRLCQEAFGAEGQCCPIGSESTLSRCCCNYLLQEPLFVDEVRPEGVKEVMQFEHAMILISDYLPWVGGGVFFVMFFMAICIPAYAKERMLGWRFAEPKKCCRCCCCCTCCRRIILLIVWPALLWRTFLREEGGFLNMVCRWFCRPGGLIPRGLEWFRGLLFVLLGIFIGGILPWLTLGAMFGQAALFALLCMGLSIRWSKSPYEPGNEQDMVLRQKVTRQPLKDEYHTAQAVDVGRDFISCVVLGVIYFLKFIFDLLVCRAQLISYEAIPSIEADRVVDIFPGLVKLLREPGMVIYDIMYWASQVMTFVIGYFVGIPKCEGSCVLIGSVALVMVLVTLTKWLNYDFFGLYTAARQCAKTTRPECQKAFYQGLVMLCLSITFGAIQCAMVLFSRAIKVADPFRNTEWACEWSDLMALMVGRGLILISTVVGVTFFFLCANGHFMGQDYIIKPVGKFLKLNLDDLDPDGTGPEGGLFQCEVMLSALPTLVGVWVDWWNVQAFLVEERGMIYSRELKDPQPCLHCGRIHCKFVNVMCATGRQISLACQILPYGIVIGKMSEYANDPPLIYWGDQLSCVTVCPTPVEQRPDLGKNKIGLKLLLLVADICTFSSDFILPLVRRLCSLTMYIFMIIGIFYITEENLLELGRKVILAGFYLAFLKAAGEGLIETTLSWIVGLVYMSIARIQGTLQGVDLARTVGGQALAGSSVGAVVAVCMIRLEYTHKPLCIFIAACMGYAVSLLALILNWLLETLPPKSDEPPRRNPFPTIAKVFFASAVGALVTVFTSQVLYMRSIMATAAIIVSLQLLVQCLVLVEHKTVISENSEEGLKRPQAGELNDGEETPELLLSSATWIILTSKRMLPGLIGIAAGTLAGSQMSRATAYFTASSQGAFSALVAGLPSGLVCTLAVNSIIDQNPIIYGLFAGGSTFIGVSFWNGLVALFLGAIVGVCTGSVFEFFVVRDITAHHKEWVLTDNKRKAVEEDPDYIEEMDRRRRASTMARSTKFETAMEEAQRKAEEKELAKLQGEEFPWMLTNDGGSPVAQGALHDSVAHGVPVVSNSVTNADPAAAVTDLSSIAVQEDSHLALPPGTAEDNTGAEQSVDVEADRAAELRGVAQSTDTVQPPAVDAAEAEVAEAASSNFVREAAEPAAAVSAADGAAEAAPSNFVREAPEPVAEAASSNVVREVSEPAARTVDATADKAAAPLAAAPSQIQHPGASRAKPAPLGSVIADGFSLERGEDEEEEEPAPERALAHPALMPASAQGNGARRKPPQAAGQRSARGGTSARRGDSARGGPPGSARPVTPDDDPEAVDNELFGRWESRAGQPSGRPHRSNAQAKPRPPQRSLWGIAPPPDRPKIQPPSKPVRRD